MAQQIIVTKDNYGIGLSCNFIDKNKNPIDLTDKVVEVVIVDSNNETIDIKQAVIVDYTNAKASIVLEKIHTSTLGLYKTFWSVLDENQNITAQEDVYYYVKDKNNGSEGNVDSGFDVEDVFKNLEDRLEESEDSLKELKERTNYLNEQLETIATIWSLSTDMSKYIEHLIIPNGTHTVETLDISNVGRLTCNGKINGDVILKTTKHRIIESLECNNLTISGIWHCNISNIKCTELKINGFNDDWGTIYNNISNVKCNKLNISVESSFVNSNNFTNIVSPLLTTIGDKDFHNNVFDSCDFTGSGINRQDSKNQSNTLINYYAEGNATINGRWNIIGSSSPLTPTADIDSNILGSSGNYSGNYSDFLSCSDNIAIGGQWEEIKESGLPKCMYITNADFDIIEDLTSQDGSDRRLEITSNGSWSTVGIMFKKIISIGSFTLFSKNDNLSICCKVGSNTIYNITSRVHTNDGWYLYRGVLPKNASEINILLTTSTSSVKTVSIGCFYVSRFKTCLLPTFSPRKVRGCGANAPAKGIFDLGDIFLNKESWSSSNVGWIWNGVNWKSF